MERNSGRYTYLRRQGGGGGNSGSSNINPNHNSGSQQHNQHHSSSSLSSNSSTNSLTQYSSTNSNNSNAIYTNTSQSSLMAREPLSQHDELIRYITEAWTKVKEQDTPVLRCSESNIQLKNFKPFNLEEYWGQRLVQNIQIAHGGGGGGSGVVGSGHQ